MNVEELWMFAIVALFLLLGMFLGYAANYFISQTKIKEGYLKLEKVTSESDKKVDNKKKELEIELREKLFKMKADVDNENRDKKGENLKNERRISQKLEQVDRKMDFIERRERELSKKEKNLVDVENKIKKTEENLKGMLDDSVRQLEKISGMTVNGAKEELKNQLFEETRRETAAYVIKMENEAKEEADVRAKKIISLSIQRCAADFVAETTVSVVDLPSDDMKGRIIGREGRNIRALEVETGVDLIIDDTPEAVTISCFDPIRREIAKMAIERLINDGRIHPGRIEEIVEKVKKEMDATIKEEGEKAAFDVGIDRLHPEEIKLLGRLKYRTSYSQNVLQHSKEVAFLSGIMAAELKLNEQVAKRAGLLHDIGKAIDHHTEGTHTQIGVDLAKRYNESSVVINAIGSHHGDIEPTTPIAILVSAADALSASRPGARREMLETYVKRLEQLEKIGESFKGVEKSFAIQAGREIRVIVESDKVADVDTSFLSKDIAKKIESEMGYPGEIKVTVIRETRSVEYAR